MDRAERRLHVPVRSSAVYDQWREWYAVVFETARGVVLKCACCGKLHLRFDRVLMPLDELHLDKLRPTLWSLTASAGSPCHPVARGAFLQMGSTGAGVILGQSEVQELCELVEGARLFLDLDEGRH